MNSQFWFLVIIFKIYLIYTFIIKDSKNWTEASRSKDNIKKKFSTTSEYLIFFFSILALIIFYIIFNN